MHSSMRGDELVSIRMTRCLGSVYTIWTEVDFEVTDSSSYVHLYVRPIRVGLISIPSGSAGNRTDSIRLSTARTHFTSKDPASTKQVLPLAIRKRSCQHHWKWRQRWETETN